MTIVPVYAAVLALLLFALSLRVIRLRRRAKVSIGRGGDHRLERAIRVQGNFTEYVPMVLLLLAFAEVSGTSPAILHGLCGVLILGRISHAFGVSREVEDHRFRVFGMACTLSVLVVAATMLLLGRSLIASAFGG